MNLADIAGFIASGVPVKMEVELSDKLDKKIDLIRAEVKEISDNAVEKIDRRWYITQVLLGIGLVGNAIAMLV
jgi:hypothetical protein